MRISAKTKYGIIAILDIALHSEDGKGITAGEISGRNNLSIQYLQQVLAGLCQGRIISSNRGFGGGYRLTKPAGSIYLSDIIPLFDSNLCRTYADDNGGSSTIENFLEKALWEKFDDVIEDFTEHMSMADLIREYTKASGASG
jgi:Rrf2 family iron-sulfur cluster assembly transcriptional regulator